MKYVKFNLNNHVKVKLTELGYQVWKQKTEQYAPQSLHKPLGHYKAQADADGYVAIQAHQLMDYFGEHMYPSSRSVFKDMNVLVQVGD